MITFEEAKEKAEKKILKTSRIEVETVEAYDFGDYWAFVSVYIGTFLGVYPAFDVDKKTGKIRKHKEYTDAIEAAIDYKENATKL